MILGWSRQSIAGKDIDVFDAAAKPRFAASSLHGVGLETLPDNPAYTAELAKQGLACVCPRGRRGWWLDRISLDFDPTLTPEKFVVEHVVPFVRSHWSLGGRAL